MIVGLLLILTIVQTAVAVAVVLTPDSEPVRLVAHADALIHRVQLEQLSTDVTYEVRVSYVATTPCSFTIRLVDERVSTGRHLLNAEKLLFRLEHGDRAEVEILADLSDYLPAPNSPGNDVRQVPFVVALESTWHGAPRGVAPLAALLGALSVVVALIWRLVQRKQSIIAHKRA